MYYVPLQPFAVWINPQELLQFCVSLSLRPFRAGTCGIVPVPVTELWCPRAHLTPQWHLQVPSPAVVPEGWECHPGDEQRAALRGLCPARAMVLQPPAPAFSPIHVFDNALSPCSSLSSSH